MGRVYIIGTGPGDEELLTVKAVETLKKCTAVLYDRLVSNNILNYVSDKCKIYYCGKEPGSHYKTQEEINESLVKLAKKGHVVGRIKGGDPYVFGRGGEEVLALKENSIDYEVIPGITSPIAVLNYAGIPITHRGIAQSFHVVTGMSSKGLNINFEALSKETGTLVFMMGFAKLEFIKENLVKNGKDINTPAAVIMRGTCSKQKKVVGTLKNICEKVKKSQIKSPCIIVIGDVVKLNEKLNWYEEKPLFGKNICITRSKSQSTNLKANLKELGAEVTPFYSIDIKSTENNLDLYRDKLNSYDHIIFTSTNSVNIFFDYLKKNKYDVRQIKAKISCVGKATSNALNDRGIYSFAIAREFTGENLFEVLKDDIKEDEKIMLPLSSLSKENLYNNLKSVCKNVDRVFIYDTVCGSVKDTRPFEEVDIIFFTSPSTVKNMIEIVGIEKIREKECIAIGPITNDALKEVGIKARVCKKHSEEGFLNEIIDFAKL